MLQVQVTFYLSLVINCKIVWTGLSVLISLVYGIFLLFSYTILIFQCKDKENATQTDNDASVTLRTVFQEK